MTSDPPAPEAEWRARASAPLLPTARKTPRLQGRSRNAETGVNRRECRHPQLAPPSEHAERVRERERWRDREPTPKGPRTTSFQTPVAVRGWVVVARTQHAAQPQTSDKKKRARNAHNRPRLTRGAKTRNAPHADACHNLTTRPALSQSPQGNASSMPGGNNKPKIQCCNTLWPLGVSRAAAVCGGSHAYKFPARGPSGTA